MVSEAFGGSHITLHHFIPVRLTVKLNLKIVYAIVFSLMEDTNSVYF